VKLFIINHKYPNYDQTNFFIVLARSAEEAKKLVEDEVGYRSRSFEEPEEIDMAKPYVVASG
jgi:hypothetical protein